MNTIYLVIASNDPVHERDLDTQRNTWVCRLPVDHRAIWLRGHGEKTYTLVGDTLFVPCEELYANILEKTVLGVKYIVDNLNFELLIRTNVSTFFEPKRLEIEFANGRYAENFVGGYFDKTNGGYFGSRKPIDYISGTGIFMSFEAARALSYMNFAEYRGTPDDVAISHYFARSGFALTRMLRNNLASTYIFLPSYYTRTKSSAISSVASDRMQRLNRFFAASRHSIRIQAWCSIYRNEYHLFRIDSEGFVKYLQRNRIVLQSYLATRGWRIWSKIMQR